MAKKHEVIAIEEIFEQAEPEKLAEYLTKSPESVLRVVFESKAAQMFDVEDPDEVTDAQIMAAAECYYERAGIPPYWVTG